MNAALGSGAGLCDMLLLGPNLEQEILAMKSRLTTVVLLSLLVSCAPAADPAQPVAQQADTTEADAAAIRGLIEKFRDAFEGGDVDSMMAVYTADAVVLPPGDAVQVGSAAIRASFQEAFAQYTFASEHTIEEVEVLGDWGFVRWTAHNTATPKDGGDPTPTTSRGISIARRQADGGWKIARDIWNHDAPGS